MYVHTMEQDAWDKMYLGFLPEEYFSKGDAVVKGEHKNNPASDPPLSLAGLSLVGKSGREGPKKKPQPSSSLSQGP